MNRSLQLHLSTLQDQPQSLLDKAGELGCQYLEITGSAEQLLQAEGSPNLAPYLPTADQPNQLTCLAIHVSSFEAGFLSDNDEQSRQQVFDQLTALIEMAGRTGIARISFAPAMVLADHPKRTNYQKALNRTADALGTLVRSAETEGARLSLRVSSNGFLTSPPETRELLDSIGSYCVGVDLDIDQRCDSLHWLDWYATIEPYAHVLRTTPATPPTGQLFDSILSDMNSVAATPTFDGSIVICNPAD